MSKETALVDRVYVLKKKKYSVVIYVDIEEHFKKSVILL